MDCIVHGVAKSQTRLNDFNFNISLHVIANLVGSEYQPHFTDAELEAGRKAVFKLADLIQSLASLTSKLHCYLVFLIVVFKSLNLI